MSLPNKNSFNNLGGELTDYSPVTDPTTDLSAEADNETRSDVAAMTRTAIRAWCKFTVDGYGVCSIAATDYDAVYGNSNSYKPTVIRNGAGEYVVTFPTTVLDARAVSQTVNLQSGWCNVETASNSGYLANATILTANTVRIFLYRGSAADPGTTSDKVCLYVL